MTKPNLLLCYSSIAARARMLNVDLCTTPLGGFIVNFVAIGGGIGLDEVKVKVEGLG